MTQPQSTYSKELLRKRMDEGLEQFLQVIDRLSEEQMTARTESAGWNRRDHLTHLAAWADGIAALSGGRTAGPPWGWTWMSRRASRIMMP